MRECKKVKFIDEAAAIYYVNKLKRTSTRTSIPTGQYLCPYCLSWHLTSRKSKEEETIEKLKAELQKKNEKIKAYKEIITRQANNICEIKELLKKRYGNNR